MSPSSQTVRDSNFSTESLSTMQAGTTKSHIGRVGLSLFFTLAEEWGLNQNEQLSLLGLSSRTTLKNYRERVAAGDDIKLPNDTLERLSLIAGIRKAVELLFPENRWNDYMHASNRALNDLSPLQWMLEGRVGSLYDIRRYLDAQRGAHFG